MSPISGQALQIPSAPEPQTQTLPPLAQPTNLLTDMLTHPPLTLQDLLTRALANNPTLAQSQSATTRAEALAHQAALYPNPTVGYQGDQIRGGSLGGGEQGAFFAQTIPLGGKLTLRRKALEAEAATTRTSTKIQQTRVRADVTQAFYAALAAQRYANIRCDLLLVAQDAVQTAHQLANIGQADTPDILATEVEQEQAQLADEQAQRLFLARFHTLAILSGNSSLAPAPLQADFEAAPNPDLTRIVGDNPLIGQALSEIAAAEARLVSARREVAPDLQLKAGEQYNFEQLGSLTGNQSGNHQVGPQTFASAAITIPLWNRNQGNIAAAEAGLEAARQNLRRVQLGLRAQSEPLLEALAVAQARASRYRTSIIPRATLAAQLDEQKYNQMAQAYPQVLIARRTVLTLQLQYTDILAEIWQATIMLDNANLSGSLEPLPATMPLVYSADMPLQ